MNIQLGSVWCSKFITTLIADVAERVWLRWRLRHRISFKLAVHRQGDEICSDCSLNSSTYKAANRFFSQLGQFNLKFSFYSSNMQTMYRRSNICLLITLNKTQHRRLLISALWYFYVLVPSELPTIGREKFRLCSEAVQRRLSWSHSFAIV